jgi:FlaA1/EpsC-like NDP-sugar epimerase
MTRLSRRPDRPHLLRRRLLFFLADLGILTLSVICAYLLRFDGRIPAPQLRTMWVVLGLSLAVKLPVFAAFRLYRFSWAHVGVREMSDTVLACVTGSAALSALILVLRQWPPLVGISRSVLGVDFALTLIGVGAVRLAKRVTLLLLHRVRGRRGGMRTLIIGAGDAGTQLARALREEPPGEYLPVGLVDDDPAKRGLAIHGLRVLGARRLLPVLVERTAATLVIVAMPSASPDVVRETVDMARRAGVREIRIVPSLSQLYTGEVRVSEVRDVRPEDLLRRDPVRIDPAAIVRSVAERTVLVTGAAGSIGSEICHQILRFRVRRLVALDHNETGLFDLDRDLRRRFGDERFDVEIADIRDADRVSRLFATTEPDVVFHAAAYKHVPLMERSPSEAVKTNVFGTKLVLESACRAGASTFVLISTDKAVNPTSVMGETKRVAERIVCGQDTHTSTRCLAVRFGNVLGSRGSVIPTFLEQIQRGGPVTVTHPDMERYFMVTSEAVLLVLQAAAMGKGGEIFVLDMGEPVRIADLARDLIRFHGLEPDDDIPVIYTGMRPGEKLSEELLTAEEGTEATTHRRVQVAKLPLEEDTATLREALHALHQACQKEGPAEIRAALRATLPGGSPSDRPARHGS